MCAQLLALKSLAKPLFLNLFNFFLLVYEVNNWPSKAILFAVPLRALYKATYAPKVMRRFVNRCAPAGRLFMPLQIVDLRTNLWFVNAIKNLTNLWFVLQRDLQRQLQLQLQLQSVAL